MVLNPRDLGPEPDFAQRCRSIAAALGVVEVSMSELEVTVDGTIESLQMFSAAIVFFDPRAILAAYKSGAVQLNRRAKRALRRRLPRALRSEVA